MLFISEYDPNPLLSLSKRRRRTSVNSTTEEKRLTQTNPIPSTPILPTVESPKVTHSIAEKENTDTNKQDTLIDSHKERKKLKKRRRDKYKKLLFKDDKAKKKKHRCCDEHCKHRKHHKKHKKHKKHHHRSENETVMSSMSSEMQVDTPEPEADFEKYEMEPEEYDEVNDTIIEETNFVHKKILESKLKVSFNARRRELVMKFSILLRSGGISFSEKL